MKDSENKGLGFLDVLCLILITLKLTGQIDWWWGWVILPWVGQYILGYLVLIIGWIWRIRSGR